MLRIAVAAFHLLALGLGMGAVLTRGNVLRETVTRDSLHRAFRADTLWGVAAALWLATGLWRLLAGLDKPTAYYVANHLFAAKMGLFAAIVLLEIWPMVLLVRWRVALRRGRPAGEVAAPASARCIATISHVQALLVAVMIFVAVAMARGYGTT